MSWPSALRENTSVWLISVQVNSVPTSSSVAISSDPTAVPTMASSGTTGDGGVKLGSSLPLVTRTDTSASASPPLPSEACTVTSYWFFTSKFTALSLERGT